jgi:hypothetical protein
MARRKKSGNSGLGTIFLLVCLVLFLFSPAGQAVIGGLLNLGGHGMANHLKQQGLLERPSQK